MTKIFRMVDLDCAHCAEKMEKKIAKIKGINSVSISFMAQKMILDCEERDEGALLADIRAAVKSVDADCDVK